MAVAALDLFCPCRLAEMADRDVPNFKDPDSNDEDGLGDINMFQVMRIREFHAWSLI